MKTISLQNTDGSIQCKCLSLDFYKPNFNANHRYCHKDQIKEYFSILLRMQYDKIKWNESIYLDLC